MFDCDQYPFLFSTTTRLARNIDNDFYGKKHYVWAALRFDKLREQAASSNPLTIAKRFIEDVYSIDENCDRIYAHIVAVQGGAEYMYNNGMINDETKELVDARIKSAPNTEFLPLVYVIDTKKVESRKKDRIHPVDPAETARNKMPEYKIYDLTEDECEVIDLGGIIESLDLIERMVYKRGIKA